MNTAIFCLVFFAIGFILGVIVLGYLAELDAQYERRAREKEMAARKKYMDEIHKMLNVKC